MDYSSFTSDPMIAAAGFNNTATYSQVLVEQVLTDVACLLPKSRWASACTGCDRRETAIKYLTAHRLTTLKQTGVIGGGSSETSGLVSGQIASISASQGSQSISFSPALSETSGSGWLAEGQTPTIWWNLFLGIAGTGKVDIGFTV